jgi:hypothetical protein
MGKYNITTWFKKFKYNIKTTSKLGSILKLAHQYLNQMKEHQNHFKGTKGLYKHENNAWFTLAKF